MTKIAFDDSGRTLRVIGQVGSTMLVLLTLSVCSTTAAAAPKTGTDKAAEASQKATSTKEPNKSSPKEEVSREDNSRDVPPSDSVTIIGSNRKVARIAGSAHKVGQETLERQEHDDIHRILKQIPGVYVREEDGFGLRPNIGLRGANSDRSAKVSLMEDGVLMAPAPYSAPAAYYFPLATRLVDVEVFKGPAAIKHGPNTIGGAVNTVTRSVPAQGHEGGIDLAAGMRRTQKVHTFYGFGDRFYGVLIEGASIKSDGFKELDGGGDTGFDKFEVMLKFRVNNDPGANVHHRLDVKLGYSDERSHETYLGLTEDDFNANPYRRYAASQLGLMEWGRSQLKLTYSTFIGENIESRITAYRTDFARSWRKVNGFAGGINIDSVLRNPDPRENFYPTLTGEYDWQDGSDPLLAIGVNKRTYVAQGVQTRFDWKSGRGNFRNHLQLGGRFHTDNIERNHSEAPYFMQSRRLVRLRDVEATVSNQGSANAIALYVFDEIKLFKRLHLTPGARMERISTTFDNRTPTLTGGAATEDKKTSTVFLPGGGAWFAIDNHWGLLAGVHQGFSPQSPQNESNEAEKSTNYELGTRWKYDHIRGELIGYLNDYSNLTSTCTQSAGCNPDQVDAQFNAGEARVYGAEFNVNSDVRVGGGMTLSFILAYTLTIGEFMNDFSSGFSQWGEVEKGDELPYIPMHQGACTIGLAAAKWGMEFTTTHVSDMRDAAGQGSIPDQELIPAHTVVDANAFIQVAPNGRIYATGDNILNRKYMVSRRPFGARPGKPFQLTAGYKHTF